MAILDPNRLTAIQLAIDGLSARFEIRADAEWKEGDHPRAKNGQFGSGGGSSTSKKNSGDPQSAPQYAGLVNQKPPPIFRNRLRSNNLSGLGNKHRKWGKLVINNFPAC